MTHIRLYKRLFAAASAIPFALSAIAQEVNQAQTSPDDEATGLEVIQVTAQKRVSSLQETPIAISAFNESMLEDQDIQDPADMQFAVPNAMVSGGGSYSVRGVGNTAVSSTADPGMGVHVNGVYVTRNASQNEFYDVQAVEVLRGPQGTLFGRNTTAGVVNTITKRPTDVLEASITTDIANYNGLRTKGFVNVPLSDTVLQRFAFNTVKRDGYSETIAKDVDFDTLDGRDQWSVRSSTSFEFSDQAEGFLFAQYFREHSDRSGTVGVLCKADPVLGCDNSETLGNEFPNTSFTDGSLANGALAGLYASLGYGTRPDFWNTNLDGSAKTTGGDPRKVGTDYQPTFNSEHLLLSFEFNYEFSDYVFTSVSAYHDREDLAYRDFDNSDGSDAMLVPQTLLLPEGRTELTTRHSSTRTDGGASKQWSQEFRVASYLDGPFNYTAGAFYLKYEGESLIKFHIPEVTAIAAFKALPDELGAFTFDTPIVETDSWAIFTEGYYDVSEDFKLTVGIRYTEEEKYTKTRTYSSLDVFPMAPGSYLTSDFDMESTFKYGEGEWEEFTGKLGFAYTPDIEATDETLFFGTLSRGYKGGGINPGASDSSFPTFDPEYINALEVGTKNTLLDRTFQANVTAFMYKYDGLQVGGILGDGTTFNTNVDAEVKGAEFEFVAAPIDGFRVNLNLSLLDSEIVDDFLTSPDISSPSGSGPVNLQGNSLQYSPESSVQFGIQYSHELSDNWDITYRAQTYWQDSYYSRLYNIKTDKQDDWSQSDVSVTVRDLANEKWEFELYVKNVSDEASITGLGVDNSLVGRYRTPTYLDPRTYGVRVTYRFE
ncbi:TonB-dependent receptor [uncultured Paraglaciecola sp.]|uniref:TonB-dependent receptor n=1 Tax=uncultured Paraglaciecola sp. TaxID=1765024 RepID=UPI002634713C|nr:TonB-dependent receptor [uncultured Paraglaciecola sp.]